MKRKIELTQRWLCCICFLLLSLQQTYAQSITVRGQVTENNRPLAGVTVKNIGSTMQAQTDTQGKYTLSAATVKALEFTFLGYAKMLPKEMFWMKWWSLVLARRKKQT
jgi:hypothetical protein